MLVALSANAPTPGPVALLRLPGPLQELSPAGPDAQLRQPAPGDPAMWCPAGRRIDPRRALPHLEVGLGAVPHVALEPLAGVTLHVGQPVGVEPVMGDALLVVIEDALAGALAPEGHLSVVGAERIADRGLVGGVWLL